MAFQDTPKGFIDYRYYKPKFHYAKKIAIKFEVNQDDALIMFSAAICSEEDNFCRKTAREICDERMQNNDCYVGKYDREITILENIREITSHTAQPNEDNKPSRFIRQLDDAFAEVEISKMIDDSCVFTGTDF